MRKLIGFFSIIAIALTLFSCKKDFTCTCTQNGAYLIHFEYQKMEKEGAQAACAADEYLQQNENADPSITCSID